ncbi:alpha-(1,3)-fucosyltransferase C-like isoform X2 [Mizuhopecten yessoensis]|uniref:alpha-(1,3)-fucosyltransferase C-like isoform X2 n=1 Tax=Mizuhopecten yessoensis TaxID=6573 RepID=UPI000B45CBF7|nr:alpha-(1,3)-fucosyltransferase C-like isoform X2 [Mizuhopecten yessoensis]
MINPNRGAVNFFCVTLFGSTLMIGLFLISPSLGPVVLTRTVYPPRLVNTSESPIRVHYVNRPPWISMDIFSKCGHKCYMTAGGGNSYSDSEVVVFHTPYVKEKHPPKKIGQIWVFHSLEPPWLHWCKFNNWKRKFNWTISYRRDSDILYAYGGFKTRNINQSAWDNETSQFSEKWLKKSKDIAWMVSHCGTPSKRDDYVNILKNMTMVDIYGKCGNKKCHRDKTEECLKPYKFYLSFENELCEDYITEKSFKMYNSLLGPIPISRGGSNYSMYLPPGSYIDASKFKHISHLKAYVDSVSRNITKVKEYMSWRKHYKIYVDHSIPFCELCRRLHLKDKDKYKRMYEDIGEWHRGDKSKRKSCREPQDLL